MVSGKRVFVVDDHEGVRDSLRMLLTVWGYCVETFASAESFLASGLADQDGCVLIDVAMIGMDGFELLQELNRRGSRLAPVLMSGHTPSTLTVHSADDRTTPILMKPLDPGELAATLRRALDGGKQGTPPATDAGPPA